MNNFFERIRNFMYGRNGIDKFSIFLLFFYLLINVIGSFIYNPIVHYSFRAVSLLIIILVIYRILSKNLYRRQYEESRFEQFLLRINFNNKMYSLRRKFNRMSIRMRQIKTHRFRTCPQCKEHLRLSKRRGKRVITCPKCGKKFTRYIIF